MGEQYLGSLISLITKNDMRYEGYVQRLPSAAQPQQCRHCEELGSLLCTAGLVEPLFCVTCPQDPDKHQPYRLSIDSE